MFGPPHCNSSNTQSQTANLWLLLSDQRSLEKAEKYVSICREAVSSGRLMYHINCVQDGAYAADYTSPATVVQPRITKAVVQPLKLQTPDCFMCFAELQTALVCVCEKWLKDKMLLPITHGNTASPSTEAKRNSRVQELGARFCVG